MKKFFQVIGFISLIGFSFFYTNKTALVVKNLDSLMIEIQKISDSKKVEPQDATIVDNTIIPGKTGLEVDIDKSYRNMKRVGALNESLLEYKNIRPKVSISKIYDKYIIQGNPQKKTVGLIFLVKENDSVDKIVNILKEKQVSASFFVDGAWFEKNNEKVIDLINGGYTVGNLSYQMDYSNSSFVWMNTIIKRVGKQKMNFCYNEVDNEQGLEICSLQKSYTIRPGIIVKNYPTIEIKKQVEAGSIVSLSINDTVIKELPLILDYLSSKDLKAVNMVDHISEK